MIRTEARKARKAVKRVIRGHRHGTVRKALYDAGWRIVGSGVEKVAYSHPRFPRLVLKVGYGAAVECANWRRLRHTRYKRHFARIFGRMLTVNSAEYGYGLYLQERLPGECIGWDGPECDESEELCYEIGISSDNAGQCMIIPGRGFVFYDYGLFERSSNAH